MKNSNIPLLFETKEKLVHSCEFKSPRRISSFFTLTQTELINKVLKVSQMEDWNGVGMPALTVPIGADTEKPSFD